MVISIDIGRIEARHSTNREVTMLRARGWFVSLATLTATFISWMVSRLAAAARDVAYTSADKPPVEKADATKRRGNKRPKKRRGGGGPWRAFLHFRMCRCGEKAERRFTLRRLSELSEEYRRLAPEQKQVFVEAGRAATEAHRAGHRAFAPVPKMLTPLGAELLPQPSPEPGDVLASGAIVASSAAVEAGRQLQYSGPGTFLEEYAELKKSLKEKRPDPHQLTGQEVQALRDIQAECFEDPVVADLAQRQHASLSSSFQKVKANCSALTAFHWFPPIVKYAQAGHSEWWLQSHLRSLSAEAHC